MSKKAARRSMGLMPTPPLPKDIRKIELSDNAK